MAQFKMKILNNVEIYLVPSYEYPSLITGNPGPAKYRHGFGFHSKFSYLLLRFSKSLILCTASKQILTLLFQTKQYHPSIFSVSMSQISHLTRFEVTSDMDMECFKTFREGFRTRVLHGLPSSWTSMSTGILLTLWIKKRSTIRLELAETPVFYV